ncbi:pancreatic triacylglycerol lipase-like [Rhynchophorus ferrugineus]|uniref:pancreatic triacylglycerol lipase-like n=1 Tax=Rhynchophorus ferrugineus TaxID=354439 RepID=UPI003FCD77A7
MSFYVAFVLALLCCHGCKGSNTSDISEEYLSELLVLRNFTEQLDLLDIVYELPLELIDFQESNVYFYVYTKLSPLGTKLDYDESNRLSSVLGFSTNVPTVFIIHGWMNSYQSGVNTDIITPLLAYDNVNIISVDWSSYSFLLYTLARLNVPNVGKTVGYFIESMLSNYDYSADDIVVVGHSLGAHVAGIAGKKLNGTLGVIVGLDPAGPLFFESDTSGRLNVGDAQYVEAIHTDGSLFGVNYDVGNIDFWPNGGYVQPDCIVLLSTCSHMKSYLYFAESLSNDQFYARQCDSYSDYTGGECADNTVTLMGSLSFNTSLTGNFYLNTSSTSPYGLGNIYDS